METVRDDPRLGRTSEGEDRRCQEDSQSTLSVPSVRSFISGVTTLHSAKYSYQYHGRRKSSIDDQLSDVPTISESIADMLDLQELGPSAGDLDSPSGGDFCPKAHEAAASSSSAVFIDNRLHPLAPYSCPGRAYSFDSHGHRSILSDLGRMSDVKTSRSDASVASAETCLSIISCSARSDVRSAHSSKRATSEHGPSGRVSRQPFYSNFWTHGQVPQNKPREG